MKLFRRNRGRGLLRVDLAWVGAVGLGLMVAGTARAQSPSSSSAASAASGKARAAQTQGTESQSTGSQSTGSQRTGSQTTGSQVAPPQGQVLFERHGETPAVGADASASEAAGSHTSAIPPADETAKAPELTDRDRAAIRIDSYDLDIRLAPATAQLNGRARLTLRNDSDIPLTRIALEISSTLRWQSASLQGTAGRASVRLPIAQHLLDTDADHTGQANELILALPTPLAPGARLALDTFYSGTIRASGGRLERLGATAERALATDWDAIAPGATALRGFGNVLWYPVAAPQLFLSDGSLIPAIGKERREHAGTKVHLRLSIEYAGAAPVAAYFCGRRKALVALNDDSDAPVAFGSGIATADFPAEPIGIRPLSLFVLAQPETLIAPLPTPEIAGPAATAKQPRYSSSDAGTPPPAAGAGTAMLAVETTDEGVLAPLAASAERVAPLLQSWFGTHPLTALTLIDHKGQPFEDGPLLVAPLAALARPAATPLLAHSLTHAWVQTGQPWMDEGLAEFVSLLWTERDKGRDAAVAQLDELMQPVAAAETAPPMQAPEAAHAAGSSSSSLASTKVVSAGEPLITASDELFSRRKAAAVWWMLRDIAGEQPLQLALSAWCTQPPRHDSPEAQARAFEALLERISGKDLGWFFANWVLHDRGLPKLSIVDVAPRQLAAGTGRSGGWLVAVTMRNQGGAEAEVPLVIRSGEFSITKRIRIPGFSSVTDREVVDAAPTEVILNDGSTPETGPSTHTRTIVLQPE